MTVPPDPTDGRPGADPDETVSLSKPARPEDDPDFDPYRFGAPDHPIPAEYAPPGYKGPIAPPQPVYPTQPPPPPGVPGGYQPPSHQRATYTASPPPPGQYPPPYAPQQPAPR